MENIIKLRKETGAGILACKKMYNICHEDYEQACIRLKKQREGIALRKSRKVAKEGIVISYVHNRSKIGVLLELNCETEVASQTDIFKTLAKEIAMHITSESPMDHYDDQNMLVESKEEALLNQRYFKNEEITVRDLIYEHIARIGENISVKRFARFQIGEV